MKQFQFEYKNDWDLYKKLEEITKWCDTNPSYTTVFRIYSDDIELNHIKHVCDILDEKMPDALYLGCTSNANILGGAFTESEIILTCTIFEYETTRVELMQLPFSEGNAKEDARRLKKYCDTNTWVNTVEMHATMLGMSLKEFCDEMSTLRNDIQVFGGGACNPDITPINNVVFSKGNGFSERGIVFLLLGGSDLHTYSTFICGWQPIKRKFKVTKADKEIMYELNGEPAFNIYQKFLNIENNDQFVFNSIEFPFLLNDNGTDVLRCAVGVNDDDSIVMTSYVPEGSEISFSFGDPETILSSIMNDGQKIAEFRPEVIQTFSCAARKAFWGENVSKETIQFNSVAPTSGFYTSGEFLRVNDIVHIFNSTLVFAAMREGEPKSNEIVKLYDANLDKIESERITVIRRFISFIEATTAEYEALNRKLAVISVTDGLTGLYNRGEIARRIRGIVDERNQNGTFGNLSLIMLDIDNFKKINDTYSHREGDQVIRALSEILRNVKNDVPSASIGRWGGEEFMIMLPESEIDKAVEIAEKIRVKFASVSYENAGCQTISVGVIQAKDGERADAMYIRVDEALYKAKDNGKNQTVKL
ncbi:MAG: GGDEF domain-containing protein [Oscillospiraceae bacterium]|nr:GGDEF domain-containing protein [Oscillospiraceae bacterium]